MARTPNFLRTFDGRYTELVLTYLSDGVSATLYFHSRDTESKVLAHVQKKLPVFSHHPHRNEIIEESLVITKNICERVLSEAQELYTLKDILKDDQRIDYVSCFLSVPWVHYAHYNHHEDFPTSQRINSEDINQRLADDIPQNNMRLDRHIAPVYANGYPTGLDVVLANKIRSLDFGVSESFARFDELETLYQLLASELNISTEQLHFYSVGNTLKAYTQACYAPHNNYVLAHVHGYSSDVTVVLDGEIVYAGVINFGYYDFADKLLRAQVAPNYQGVWSILTMRSRSEVLEGTEKQIARVGAEISTQFQQTIKKHMADEQGLSEPLWIDIPRDWYIVADKAVGRYFATFLRDEDSSRRMIPVLQSKTNAHTAEEYTQALHAALIGYRNTQSGLTLVQ